MKIQKNRAIYIGLLIIVWACAYVYIFNEKIDINGDNCRYYTFASSLASGQGYADISAPTPHPTNAFPPGYPLLMTPLRFFTDSIIAQKILNGLFLLGGALLLFFFMIKRKIPESLDDDERDVLLFRFNRGYFPLSEYEERKAIL